MSDPTIPDDILQAFGLTGGRPALLRPGGGVPGWRLDLATGPIIVRRHDVAGAAAAALWEHGVLQFLAARDWPVPLPLVSATGATAVEREGHAWSAAPLLPGEPAREDSPGRRAIQGRLLGRLHRDLARYGETAQRPGAGKVWELDLMVSSSGAGTFNQLVAAFIRDYPELGMSVRRQWYRNLQELSRLHYPDLPSSVVHGEFELRHLLFTDGELTGLTGFGMARRDALVCDLAPLLVRPRALEPRLFGALLGGYQAVRPLSEEEWLLLPALARSSLLGSIALLLMRWRHEGGEPAEIARIVNERIPAFDAAEKDVRALPH